MPSPNENPAAPKGLKTTLYIYHLINISQVSREGNPGFYKTLPGEAVKEIQTDEQGYFKTRLRPGTYSLFIKKGEVFYSSEFDDKKNIHPVDVSEGGITGIVFRAKDAAVY